MAAVLRGGADGSAGTAYVDDGDIQKGVRNGGRGRVRGNRGEVKETTMSHATLTVKVTAKRLAAHKGDMNEALAEMMAPYDESTKDPRFCVFNDVEPEYRSQYENESTTKIRTPEGDLLWSWDDRFRVPGRFSLGSGTHRTPDDCEEVEVPFKELYPSFDAFITDYAGYKFNEAEGKYGYYRNPSAKWDWYQIGGRWRGFFPVKPDAWDRIVVGESGAFDNEQTPGHSDVVRLCDIDMDVVANKTRERAEKFWGEWQEWLGGKRFNAFDGPRHIAMSIGLLRVEQGPALSDHAQRAISWAGEVPEKDPRSSWHDVARLMSKDDFMAKYIDCFCPIKTYAALDNDGWHAPGTIGWFGCSDDTPDAYVQFAREFVGRFIKNGSPSDTLVLIDYHI